MIRLAVVLFLLLPAALYGADKPNIIVFLADDLGHGDLGCQGHPRIKSPHLDAFAKQGVRLTTCYSASAVCSPSRSAILTGRTPHRNGVYTWIAEGSEVHLRTSEITLPKLLKAEGYATAHVGKWHLNGKFNSPEQPQPGDHGYDHWMATQNNAAPSHKNPVNFVRNGKAVGPMEGFSAPLVVDEAVRWLDKSRDTNKPFFLAVWTHEPHLPIESDPKFQEPYNDLSEDFRQHHGNVSQLDHAFGTLMRALDDRQLTNNTAVFFTADNGPEGDGTKGRTRGVTGGLRGRKRSMHEGGIRVPGMVRWPGTIKPGTVCTTPVVGSDLFPTILEMCGAKPPTDRIIDGISVLPALTGKVPVLERKVPLFWRLDMAPPREKATMAMRDGDFKVLASADLKNVELYDLAKDPAETTNLNDSQPERAASMRDRLKALNAGIESEGPDWWRRLSPNGGTPINKK
jgi:arylsulfatase A